MRVLLDTATLIWWADDDKRLGPEAVRVIEDPGTDVFVSAVSGWEIAIKVKIGKFRSGDDVDLWLAQGLFEEMPLSLRDAMAAGNLPLHHKDPFDRFLVAQAREAGLVLVTPDAALRQYDVSLMDARV